MQEGKEGKGKIGGRELLKNPRGGEAGDECIFIPVRESGWQMRSAPGATGGESGHGAAKPDGVIHRYLKFSCPTPSNREPTILLKESCS
jgi:hypothetical protein